MSVEERTHALAEAVGDQHPGLSALEALTVAEIALEAFPAAGLVAVPASSGAFCNGRSVPVPADASVTVVDEGSEWEPLKVAVDPACPRGVIYVITGVGAPERTCPEPGGCESCPFPSYCEGLRVGAGVTTRDDEASEHARAIRARFQVIDGGGEVA